MDNHKLMIYAAVATMHFYRKDIIPLREGEQYGVFAEKNAAVIQRVFDEVLHKFNYELSHMQIGTAIKAYTAESFSVEETEIGGALKRESAIMARGQDGERLAREAFIMVISKEYGLDLLGVDLKAEDVRVEAEEGLTLGYGYACFLEKNGFVFEAIYRKHQDSQGYVCIRKCKKGSMEYPFSVHDLG